MNNFIKQKAEWQKIYTKNRNNVWFHIFLSNKEIIYLRNYKEWLILKQYCESSNINIDKIKLKYKSHSVDIDTHDAKAIYLVQSILGSLSNDTKHTVTVGILSHDNDKIKKTIWILPEIVEYITEYDDITRCFKEALIYNNDRTKQKT